MRTIVIVVVVVLAAAGLVAASYQPVMNEWQRRSMPKWRMAEVGQGDIIEVVNSTGTVKPTLQISVGSFVSGPLDEKYQLKDVAGNDLKDKYGDPLHMAEFNQEVRAGDQLAKIDPRLYEAAVARDTANKKFHEKDLKRIEAQLTLADRDLKRAELLRKQDEAFIARAEIDKITYGFYALQAQKESAEASIEQAASQLKQSEANLAYTDIKAPRDGIVISRKFDPGQTVAAQFQTPELFVLGVGMREKMHVHATVDEADIGLIRAAQTKSLPVTFTVDAYEDLFEGTIEEIRLSSTLTANVVTYPVIVAAANPDLKLLPGMTASISFEVARRQKVVKIPNSALRFFPLPQHVRKEDRPLLQGNGPQAEADEPQENSLSAVERTQARERRSRRHVWVQDGFLLKAVEVHTGLSDSRYTELTKGDVKPGMKLVIGIDTTATGWGG